MSEYVEEIKTPSITNVDIANLQNPVYEKFIETTLDENGVLNGITFKDDDKFNFAVDVVDEIAKKIEDETGVEARSIVLGHIQRGGSPTARDRVTAASMGYEAVKVLLEGKTNRVIRSNNGKFEDIDIVEALNMKKGLDEEQYEVLEAMTGIYH